MKIRIAETQKIEELHLIDPKTNIDYTEDFIGTCGQNAAEDFSYDRYTGTHTCTQENFNWWKKVIEEYQQLAYRLVDLREKYSDEELEDIASNCDDLDIENYPHLVNRALDDFLSKE